MTKRKTTIVFASLFLAWGVQAEPANLAQSDKLDKARSLTHRYASQLKTTLMTAMKEGGPQSAISICNDDAPGIAKTLSTDGWSIGRTSLKLRNENNAPDHWEREQLLAFESQWLNADKPMEYFAQVNGQFRYIRSIEVQGPCLACHGSTLNPDIAEQLDTLYPDDAARGYRLGDFRGVFSLTLDSELTAP